MTEARVCSFCGMKESEERTLVEGDGCYICNYCIEFCYHTFGTKQLFDFDVQNNNQTDSFTCDLTPQEIYKKLEFNCNLVGVVDQMLLDILEVKFLCQK